MTDARHGWHNKAKDTSVVAIGEKTHKVLKCEHVTKTDDLVTQRHEPLLPAKQFLWNHYIPAGYVVYAA
jgi:hypothetical protein